MSESEVPRWYPSKVDSWLAVVLGLAPLACIAAAFATSSLAEAVVVGLGGIGFLGVIYFGLVLPMRYCITDTAIIVRFGLVHRRVPLAEITEVHPTNNPLSSPALSLDRLHIRYGQGLLGGVMISPADKQGFLDELARRAGLTRDGERLVRR